MSKLPGVKHKVIGLVSGGKDSCFNLMHCVANGHEIVALATLTPEPGIANRRARLALVPICRDPPATAPCAIHVPALIHQGHPGESHLPRPRIRFPPPPRRWHRSKRR
ncbi:meiotically up-regulated 71 protein [Cryptococcus neoformans]|nr:meiotically up-regulated 71 protein [Cryptococcus neoformans var. grubii]OXH49148.1 meiotically up-regulated 71 protein [Cryptococcus neoformans var. grubii]OXH66353.1 meiotically up-regulated 71 protein [Cryptococcus neoformans var. grubii]